MNRQEFMRQLEYLLKDIPASDRQDAIAYYNDYFDEAGAGNEEQVIRELGSPEKVAEMIKADLNLHEFAGTKQEKAETEQEYQSFNYSDLPVKKNKKKARIPIALLIVLLVFASPFILGAGTGILGVVVGILGAVFGIFVAIIACGAGFSIAGIVCLVTGLFLIFTDPLEGLATMGVGGVMAAVGILCILLFAWCVVKWIPALVRACVNLIQKIIFKNRRENVA